MVKDGDERSERAKVEDRVEGERGRKPPPHYLLY